MLAFLFKLYLFPNQTLTSWKFQRTFKIAGDKVFSVESREATEKISTTLELLKTAIGRFVEGKQIQGAIDIDHTRFQDTVITLYDIRPDFHNDLRNIIIEVITEMENK